MSRTKDKASPVDALTMTISVTDYHERVLTLLSHIENVVDDANWDKIDFRLWNAVSLAEPEVVYSE